MLVLQLRVDTRGVDEADEQTGGIELEGGHGTDRVGDPRELTIGVPFETTDHTVGVRDRDGPSGGAELGYGRKTRMAQ